MQTTAQRWEQLLYAMGGALNLAKCYWYGIEWAFTAMDEAQTVSTTDRPTINLTAGATPNNPEPLRCISTSNGQRTLGVHLAPDGNENTEHAYHIIHAHKIRQHIRVAPLGCEHIVTGFHTIWKAMIQYPLGATCFNSQQCHQLQTKYLPYFYPKWASIVLLLLPFAMVQHVMVAWRLSI
jgi:hypothetical protein